MTHPKNTLFRLIVTLTVILMVPVAAYAWLETFDSGFLLNQDVGNNAGWFDGDDNNGSNVTTGVGLGSSAGIAPGQWIFTWTAHEFDWTELKLNGGVAFRMDFQSNASAQFDDDRIGWMITKTSNDSDNFFGAQLDTPDGGIVTYWRNSANARVQTLIAPLTGIKANTWYRFTLEVTKIGIGSARLDVRLVEIDSAGNEVPGTIITGAVSDSSLWPGGAPNTRYFTATGMWPAYKNYNALQGNADNAFFELTSSCSGDFDNDGAVDGKDLSKIISGAEAPLLSNFAGQFGKSDCL